MSHLAQINIAQAQDSMDSELMRGFVERLDEINALADQAPGFIWRLQSDEGDASSIRVFDDHMMMINMSVWKDIESLKNYVYRSIHVELIQNRDAWFNKITRKHQVLWWIPEGHIPTEQEGKQRLEYLEKHGPTQQAFTFAKSFNYQ